METRKHHDVVVQQYDERAKAYLTSAVHAAGEDLALIAQAVGQRPVATALDLGCGGGHLSYVLAAQVARVTACDLSPAMLQTVAEEAQRRGLPEIETHQCAAEALDAADASFDIVATRYSAHHWRHADEGIRQMARVLKPGGLAIFMDVVSPDDPLLATWLQSIELLRDPSHVRNASVPEWQRRIETVGLALQDIHAFRLPLEFSSWVARMRTPETHVAAIRSLQTRAPQEVVQHFAMQSDGSFTVDTALLIARKP